MYNYINTIILFLFSLYNKGATALITVEECRGINGTYYKKTLSSASGYNCVTYIHYRTAIVKRNNNEYLLIYNTNMVLNSDAFEYVNRELIDKSVNTRIKANEALKFLFSFEEMIGRNVHEFSSDDINTLKFFLHGYSPDGFEMSLKNFTLRNNATINGYLSVYRGYLTYLGHTSNPIFSMKNIPSHFFKKDSYKVAQRYSKNEKHTCSEEVPRYISVDEFTSILSYVRENGSLRDELIIRLMYQCGLRIGEVLGLTADDVVNEKLPDGSYSKIAYIRNRLTDAKCQHAKSCMKIVSKEQYNTPEYNTKDDGYQFVILPDDLYDLINTYIEEEHSAIRENDTKAQRYYKNTIADRTRPENDYEDDNYYIFVNSIGTPLSVGSWNDILRKIFSSVGISVDIQKKENGLNHRFRHGFAMFNIQYLNVKEVELARLLRHRSVNSVLIYYRPTTSDKIKLKTEFANSLYEIIPSLKR